MDILHTLRHKRRELYTNSQNRLNVSKASSEVIPSCLLSKQTVKDSSTSGGVGFGNKRW